MFLLKNRWLFEQMSMIFSWHTYVHVFYFFFLILQLQGQFKCSFISTENYHSLGCLNLVAGAFASETAVIIGVILFMNFAFAENALFS